MDVEQFETTARFENLHWWFRARRRIFRTILKRLLNDKPNALVVDYGCCAGGNTASIGEEFRCVGVDASPIAIELARKNHPGVEFLLADTPADISDDIAAADIWLFADIIEHIEKDAEFLHGIRDRAKDGALLFITVPAGMDLWSPHDESHGHFRRYSRQSLIELLESCGFELEFCSYFNNRLYWPIKSVRWLNSKRGKSYGENSTDLSVPASPINRILESLFAGERHALLKAIEQKRETAFHCGVSLLALCRVKKP
jgi:SAM-dependent methyltransferase